MKAILSVFLLSVFTLVSCGAVMTTQEKIQGNGKVSEEIRNESGFQEVRVNRSIHLVLTQSPQYMVQVKADENLLPYILTEVRDNQLRVTVKDNVRLMNYKELTVYVSAPEFTLLGATTSSTLEINGPLKASSLKLFANTSAHLMADQGVETTSLKVEMNTSARAEVNAKATDAEISTGTSSRLDLRGSAESMILKMSTSSRVEAVNFQVKTLGVEASTSSRASVSVSERIEGHLNTSSRVEYAGSPSMNVRTNTSGRINSL